MAMLEIFSSVLGACTTLKKASTSRLDDEAASEMQLNAFEFRNYRTNLEASQQQVLERIVNQWCSMLVKGKTMIVEGIAEKVYLDKDLLSLEYRGDFYPLRAMSRMEMFKDAEDLDTTLGAQYCLDITFDGGMGDLSLKFNFESDRHRLNFALTLRILRTRDPSLDPSSTVKVLPEDEEEDEDDVTFKRLVGAQHYNIDMGIPIVFSVSDLKLYHKLQSTSRHTYLEFFVRYPRQDRFLYAKSPTTHLPQQALQTEDSALKKKKEQKKEDVDEEVERKKEELKRQVLGDEVPICAMRFELKNVKLKVPKIPHQIFGRLMAKDDYFPTAIGTFDFQVSKSHLQNRLQQQDDKKAPNQKEADLPATLRIPMYSSWKVPPEENKGQEYLKIGTLTIRLMGYITAPLPQGSARPDGSAGAESEEDEEDEEDEAGPKASHGSKQEDGDETSGRKETGSEGGSEASGSDGSEDSEGSESAGEQ